MLNEIKPAQNVPIPKFPQTDLSKIKIQPFTSGPLTTESVVHTPYTLNFKPDLWVIVSRGSAGKLIVYPSQQRSAIAVYLSGNMVIKLPFPNQALTVETVGFTGEFDVYAVCNLDDFSVSF